MRYQKQRGTIEVALLGALLFFACAILALNFQQYLTRIRSYLSQANAIAIVQSAVIQYATANQAAFKNGDTLMYVNDQNAPTIAELQSLGFLDLNAGTDVVSPFGSTYAVTLSPQPSGEITGAVYLTSSILNQQGQPDQIRACAIAHALGDDGICTAPASSTLLQNGTIQIANPTGKPAVVGALIYVAP